MVPRFVLVSQSLWTVYKGEYQTEWNIWRVRRKSRPRNTQNTFECWGWKVLEKAGCLLKILFWDFLKSRKYPDLKQIWSMVPGCEELSLMLCGNARQVDKSDVKKPIWWGIDDASIISQNSMLSIPYSSHLRETLPQEGVNVMQGQNEICSGVGTNITLSQVDQVLRKGDFWRLCCYGPCPIRQRQDRCQAVQTCLQSHKWCR